VHNVQLHAVKETAVRTNSFVYVSYGDLLLRKYTTNVGHMHSGQQGCTEMVHISTEHRHRKMIWIICCKLARV
jgi:hypothetical protein